FDHIFFTGSTEVGKVVMAEAAKQLTPVTLELGGKTPCIVDANTHIEYTARRIVWGKFLNAGQTCIAPDYLLVDRKVKKDLLANITSCIQNFYGNNPVESPDYGRIINEKHFNRLCKLLNTGEIIIGGETNLSDRYIAPTVIDQVSWADAVMKEEIFGPILPVIEYNDLSEAIALVNSQPKPLALYFFSNNQQKQQQILRETSSGGVSINDTVMHTGVPDLPFGGVGASGMGSYHGKASFDTFSHKKSILNKSFLVDLKVRYAPYKEKIKLVKRLISN
ncbi:MAG TPA: aldehyde dehydrogenase family protein, partial [Candidatus Sericytochromatia bacterium]